MKEFQWSRFQAAGFGSHSTGTSSAPDLSRPASLCSIPTYITNLMYNLTTSIEQSIPSVL